MKKLQRYFFCSLSFRSNRSAFSVPGSPPSNSSCCVKNGWNSVHSILSVAHPPSPSKNSSNAQRQLLRKLRERREKKLGPKKKKIWKLFLSQTREAFIWRSSWFFHRSVVLLSSFGIKKLVFGYKNLNSPAIMENRNTRLGGVRGRRPLGDLTTQQNNRQALLPNQETLPIKQVSYFGYFVHWPFDEIFRLRSIFVLFLAHYRGPLTIVWLKFFLLMLVSLFIGPRPMNWFNGRTFFIGFDAVIDSLDQNFD